MSDPGHPATRNAPREERGREGENEGPEERDPAAGRRDRAVPPIGQRHSSRTRKAPHVKREQRNATNRQYERSQRGHGLPRTCRSFSPTKVGLTRFAPKPSSTFDP